MHDYLSPDEVSLPVKVRADSCDGQYWIEEYTAEHEAAGLIYVEVDKHTWAQWEAHRASCRAWSSFCLAKGGEQYGKEHPELPIPNLGAQQPNE